MACSPINTLTNICGTKHWYASEPITMVNSLLAIDALETSSVNSWAGYVVAVYDLLIDVPFTLRLKPCMHIKNAVPVIRWSVIENGIERFERYRIEPLVGVLPFPVYQGELIDPNRAVIEIWSTGGAAEIAVAAQYLQLGLLRVANRSWAPLTDIYLSSYCITHMTGDGTDFSHYMTSCLY